MEEATKGGTVDLVIRGGKVVQAGTTLIKWIAVKGGKIVALGCDEEWPPAKKTIDASGKYILPGVVDPEHHIVPPITESFFTETRAAVAAGITTQGIQQPTTWVLDFPKDIRAAADFEGTSSYYKVKVVPAIRDVMPFLIEQGDKGSMVDWYCTQPIMSEAQAKEIPDLVERYGITSYKLYLHNMTGEHIWSMWPRMEQSGMYYYDDGTIYIAMKHIAAIGPPGVLVMHCENWEIGRVLKEELIAEGRTDPAAWEAKSPPFCEAGHVHNYSYYAKVIGCPIYIIHTTTAETVKEILKARADGVKIWAQTGPHYLTLDKSQWVVNVPLRGKEDRDACWEALKAGIIDCIGSDHVGWGRTPEDLFPGLEYGHNVWTHWDGFGSRDEALLPVMLSEGVNKGRISLNRLVEVTAENPAKIFGLYPKKGTIAVGSDADLVIVDLNREKTLTRDMVYSRQGWSLWEGWNIKGWPVMTILRGNIMMEWPEGEPRPNIIGKPIGQYIPRKPGYELYPVD